MELKLQNILMPDKDRYTNYDKLFFKSIQATYDPEQQRLAIGRYNVCDMMTYLNAFSIMKWKRYTKAESFGVRLEIEGEFELKVNGYYLLQDAAKKKTYLVQKFNCDSRQVIDIQIPAMEETLASIEINTISDCFIYCGYYYTKINEDKLNDVTLSIATTTFQKEDYIKKNLEMIKSELLSDEQVGDHIFFHVVDNGRTLDRNKIEADHVFYHPNKNVGGSGGFSRGMIESLAQNPPATNVLLMDDDVEILSESIRRTYMLLLLQKEEYKDHFISGAMLRYENMDEFHEDVGIVIGEGYQKSLKGKRTLNKKERILYNEEMNTEMENSYAGWWYCCIPATVIKKSGYSLPLFIRMDDTEYSLRNKAKIISMNGICVWHLGFLTKFNYFMEYYQVFRNFLIATSCNGNDVMREQAFHHFSESFMVEINRYNYKAAEFFIDAIRDFLKGPSFIEEEKCQERLVKMSKRNAVMKPVTELTHENIDYTSVYQYEERWMLDKLIYGLTHNGQRFFPKKKLREGLGVVAYDFFDNPQRQTLKKAVISVNPYTKEGEIRAQNRNKYKKIMKEWKHIVKEYHKNGDVVSKQFYDKKDYLVSEKFWEQYLEIENYQ